MVKIQSQNGNRTDQIGIWFVGWKDAAAISNSPSAVNIKATEVMILRV